MNVACSSSFCDVHSCDHLSDEEERRFGASRCITQKPEDGIVLHATDCWKTDVSANLHYFVYPCAQRFIVNVQSG
jgi:hypothetical protein